MTKQDEKLMREPAQVFPTKPGILNQDRTIIKITGNLTPEQIDQFRQEWEKQVQGAAPIFLVVPDDKTSIEVMPLGGYTKQEMIDFALAWGEFVWSNGFMGELYPDVVAKFNKFCEEQFASSFKLPREIEVKFYRKNGEDQF